jgi:hypothetical protein
MLRSPVDRAHSSWHLLSTGQHEQSGIFLLTPVPRTFPINGCKRPKLVPLKVGCPPGCTRDCLLSGLLLGPHTDWCFKMHASELNWQPWAPYVVTNREESSGGTTELLSSLL